MLPLAGREADIVGILTASTRLGTLLDDPRERLAACVEQKIAWVREGAGSRFPGFEPSLLPTIRVGDDPRKEAGLLIRERGWSQLTVEDVRAMPSLFLGSLEAIAERRVAARRERYGFSCYVVSDRARDTVAPLVARLAGR